MVFAVFFFFSLWRGGGGATSLIVSFWRLLRRWSFFLVRGMMFSFLPCVANVVCTTHISAGSFSLGLFRPRVLQAMVSSRFGMFFFSCSSAKRWNPKNRCVQHHNRCVLQSAGSETCFSNRVDMELLSNTTCCCKKLARTGVVRTGMFLSETCNGRQRIPSTAMPFVAFCVVGGINLPWRHTLDSMHEAVEAPATLSKKDFSLLRETFPEASRVCRHGRHV